MGVSYTQYAIIGFCLERNDYRHVIEPAKYEMQNRYDTRTGQKIKEERVLVKKEVAEYRFGDIVDRDCDVYTFADALADEYDAIVDRNDNSMIYIGEKIDFNTGDYHCDLLEGELSESSISKVFERLKDSFPDQEIKLYFVTIIG